MKNKSVRGIVQNHSANRLIALSVLISFICTVSCTTTKVHPIHTELPQEQAHGIKVGDTVKITTHSGERYKFKVESITNEEIEGEGIKIAFVEIDRIKKVRITKKVVVIVAVLITVVVAFILIGSNSGAQGYKDSSTTSGGEGK